MRKYKVIQWATGVVGTASLKGVVRNPLLELVGVKVYTDSKTGLDAGDIAGIDKTGITATQDIDAILALDADCVLYCPMPWTVEEMCRILEAGKHIVTPCPYWFPFRQDPEAAQQIEAACRKGGVNFHANGCNPGGIAERFPLTFTGWCNRIDKITMTECGDCRTYSSEGVVRELMNLGKTPEEADANPIKEMLKAFWYEPIEMIAEGIGSEVISYEARNDYILANQDIQTAVGIIAKDTIALNHYQHIGVTREGTRIVQEQIWFMDDNDQTRLQSKMDIPRESGWRIALEGDVNLNIDVDFPSDLNQEQRVAQGMATTGNHLVNSVQVVCDAENPGIKTFLDLPMITGRMGNYSMPR
ncbi:MAG: hypothetical protein P8K76_15560 [Candidatus Binatia bacterium]|nr:hypothetical protein [Candidatus Binatia bacterium]MDG1958117.1 hypothetical protein [Candidatus Binatia bacterium]MDG2011183.1 hypothetical protein [Candidatus Binatia bacterium]